MFPCNLKHDMQNTPQFVAFFFLHAVPCTVPCHRMQPQTACEHVVRVRGRGRALPEYRRQVYTHTHTHTHILINYTHCADRAIAGFAAVLHAAAVLAVRVRRRALRSTGHVLQRQERHTVHTHIHIRDTSGHVHIHSREAEDVPRTTPPLPHKHARVPTAVPNIQTTNADGALCRRSAQQQLRRDGPHPAPPGCKPSARAALLPWLALSPCRRLVSPAWGRGRCSLPRSQSYSRTRCRSVRGRDDPPLPSLPRLSPLRVPPRAVPSR